MSNLTKRFLINASLIVILVSILALTSSIPINKAQTYNEVNGIISSNITLTKSNGPYIIQQVIVSSGATLTIDAGASLNIEGNLQVSGTLIARGSTNEKIYFNYGGGSTRFESTSTNSQVDNAIMNGVPVYVSGSTTIKNSYLRGTQAQTTIIIDGNSPTIRANTIKGTLDASTVVLIRGGSPTISDNNIIAYVDNGLYPNPPVGMNRFGSANGIHVTNANAGQITNNKFYGPFRDVAIQVDTGAISVSGNSEYPTETITFPTPTPPPPTPTPIPTPTLPPYPPPSTTSPNPTQETTNSPTETKNAASIEENLYGSIIAVIVASVAINALLVVTLAFLLKKKRKE